MKTIKKILLVLVVLAAGLIMICRGAVADEVKTTPVLIAVEAVSFYQSVSFTDEQGQSIGVESITNGMAISGPIYKDRRTDEFAKTVGLEFQKRFAQRLLENGLIVVSAGASEVARVRINLVYEEEKNESTKSRLWAHIIIKESGFLQANLLPNISIASSLGGGIKEIGHLSAQTWAGMLADDFADKLANHLKKEIRA